MRKVGIAITVIGAAAFAALLAWGLSFGSGAIQADAATPTPTPTATATATPTATVTGTPAASPTAQPCGFALPTTFYGSVTINGVPATDGTKITASDKDGLKWGEDSATSAGKYDLDVPVPPPAYPPCFTGGKITFKADSTVCTPEGDTALGTPQQVNLTCGPAATATATPTVAPPTVAPPTVAPPTVAPPTATATPTPAAPPPTGMGSTGEGGGFLWWPLALAAAALTSVAGLLTARRARR